MDLDFVTLLHWTTRTIEVFGIPAIVVGIVGATIRYLRERATPVPGSDPYRTYRSGIGRSILLGLEPLAAPSRIEGAVAPFTQLLAAVGRDRLRVHAIGSPFHTKDVLKARGYRWSDGSDGRPKCWWREVDEAAFVEEDAFLADEVYGGHSEAIVQRLTATERFKA